MIKKLALYWHLEGQKLPTADLESPNDKASVYVALSTKGT